MNLEEIIMGSIKEYLDTEVHPDTSDLDLSSKIEIIKKRMNDKVKQDPDLYEMYKIYENSKYEIFFESNPDDTLQIDGWIPVDIKNIEELNKIDEYLNKGLLRKVNY